MHRAALGAGALSDEWAQERLPAHARRDGFLFLVARDAGEVVGFAYGYDGAYGRWWTEHVAAALSADQRALWLDRPHYEIVELHVRPARQRRGLGSALLAQLLTRQPYDRAILTTQAGSRKARTSTPRTAGKSWQRSTSARGIRPTLRLPSASRANQVREVGYLPATLETYVATALI